MIRATTSASNIGRRALCKGSAREEAKYAEVDSEFSAEGTMLHSLFMLHPSAFEERIAETPLTPDQLHALQFAEQLANEFIRRFMEEQSIPEDAERHVVREIELQFSDATGFLFPGHADYIVTWPAYSARVVIDAKMGFMEVADAAENLQLACYGTMAQQREPVKVCGVAIVQPRNFGPKSSSAIYSADALRAAGAEIARIFHASEEPDAPLAASEAACHFCKAKVACEAYRARFMGIATVGTQAIETLPNDKLVEVFQAIRFAKKIADEVSDEMRLRVERGELPGWKLRNTGDTTKLNDGSGYFAALKQTLRDVCGVELSAVDFDNCRDLKWGDLKKVVARTANIAEAKADELIKSVAESYVTKTPKEKAVVEDKLKKS